VPHTIAKGRAERPTGFDLIEVEVSSEDRRLVGPVTLALDAGRCVVLSGQMGSGKSLLAEYLTGLRRPGLRYDGQARFRSEGGSAALGRTALAPLDWRLVGLPTDRIDTLVGRRGERILHHLDQLEVHLERVRKLDLSALAAGERFRFLLACALAKEPDLLVVDGAASVLDPRLRRLAADAVEAAVSAGSMAILCARDQAPWAPVTSEHVGLGPPLGEEPVAVPLVPKRKEGSRAVATPPVLDVSELEVERQRHGLWVQGKPALVVDGASLFVRKGEILVLLGPSGAGKSTLLRAMAGHLPAHAGRVRVSGVDVTSGRGRTVDVARSRVQLVSPDVAQSLDPTRTVEEHLGRLLPKGSRGETELWLDRLGLPARVAKLTPDVLSEGEGFRLCLALALCKDPRVLLVDMPRSGALDADGGTLTSLLLAEKARERSFVLATSDPGISRSLADRIAVLDAGRVLEFGPTPLVLGQGAHPRTLALLDGEPGPLHDPRSPTSGCHVAGACPRELERCRSERPQLDFVPGTTRNHRVACFSPHLDPMPPEADRPRR